MIKHLFQNYFGSKLRSNSKFLIFVICNDGNLTKWSLLDTCKQSTNYVCIVYEEMQRSGVFCKRNQK